MPNKKANVIVRLTLNGKQTFLKAQWYPGNTARLKEPPSTIDSMATIATWDKVESAHSQVYSRPRDSLQEASCVIFGSFVWV
jgi:hypothetical protein